MAGENYIGSKISLISLSDIRYVGILHSINAQDSTVGLKQVRSFGTEGRRGKPDEEILASDNVFDYVVFRGSDIKDLQVFEAPPKPTPPPPQPTIPQDPAIMSMSGYPPMNPYMNNNMYMQPPPPPQQAPPQPPQQPQQPQKSQPPQQPQPQPQPLQPQVQQQRQQQPPQQRPSNGQTYWQPSYASESKVDQSQSEKNTLDELKAELEENNALQPTINEAAIEQLAKKVSELNTGDDAAAGSKQASEVPPSRRRHDNNNSNSNSNNYRNRNNRYNSNNNANFGDRQYNGNNKNKAEFTIPNSEFDFEASNAKFDKSEVVKKNGEANDEESEEVEIPQSDEFYDKTSSFFDNISCESKERNEQSQRNEPRRSHFQEERKLNVETFGQTTVDQSRYRNNYRGRGGYRGGRGSNNNYYRNNNRNNGTFNSNSNSNSNSNNSNNNRQIHKAQDQQGSL
ncbi:Scd6-like Sm domain-containing protein [Parasitella parasitica]|nr:Scd6-like Sm domain-containing protein [Parasitella parasitica]